MKKELFKEMMAGFDDAIKYRQGKKTNLRATRFMQASKSLKAADIRKIRKTLGISQFEFAQYIGSKLGTVRSWEQGARKPRSTALRLLTIAKERPAVLLQRVGR
jgi:putative transcriptional regulator